MGNRAEQVIKQWMPSGQTQRRSRTLLAFVTLSFEVRTAHGQVICYDKGGRRVIEEFPHWQGLWALAMLSALAIGHPACSMSSVTCISTATELGPWRNEKLTGGKTPRTWRLDTTPVYIILFRQDPNEFYCQMLL